MYEYKNFRYLESYIYIIIMLIVLRGGLVSEVIRIKVDLM